MKTRTIPAQITTVEDKIIGNLNLTQIILLIIPILLGTFLFIIFPPVSVYSIYKLLLTIFALIICITLCFRFKEKLVLSWSIIILRFKFRPKYWVYDKNNIYSREIISFNSKIKKLKRNNLKVKKTNLTFLDARNEILFENLVERLSLKPLKKGGVNVVSEEI